MSPKEDSPEVMIEQAVMRNDIKHINETLLRVEQKFDVAIKSFVTTEQLALTIANGEEKHKELDKQDQALEARIKSLEGWKDWVIRAILLIVIAAVLGTAFVIK